MVAHSLLAIVPLLLFTALTEAALPLPRPIPLPKPAPKPHIKRPSRLELVEYGLKGVEGLLSYYNPSTPTATTTRTATATATAAPIRLTAAWATTTPAPVRLGARAAPVPTATTTIAPSCPRAQIDLAYCAAWYGGAAWTAANAAFCLCEGLPREIDAEEYGYEFVYVPELFDEDAAECVKGYEVEAAFYAEMAGEGEDKEVRDAYARAYEEAEEMVARWREAVGFCERHPPVDGEEGVEWVEVGKEYFVEEEMLKKRGRGRGRRGV